MVKNTLFAKNITIGTKAEDHTIRDIAIPQLFESNNYARFTTFLVKQPSVEFSEQTATEIMISYT